jgi:hypothetical protein
VLKREKNVLETRNDDLYKKLKNFEEDNKKAVEEIFL